MFTKELMESERVQRREGKRFTMVRGIALVLTVSLLMLLMGCGEKGAAGKGKAAAEKTEIAMAVLTGPTGIGACDLMDRAEKGETDNTYTFTVAAANDEVTAGLISGELQIAALATNVAANLYAKSEGEIQLLALNTLGVLYILENGEEIQSLQDLKGHTLLAAGQGANPEFVLEYLLEQNGLTWSTDGTEADVAIEFQPADAISTAMATGEATLCMLPVPAVTAVTVQNPEVRIAVDLTEEWNKVAGEGKLTMGCLAVRKDFAEANPEAIAVFLEEYEASIEAVLADPQHAGELCEHFGIVPKAAIATKAIPNSNLTFISGTDMKPAIEGYFNVLFAANPASLGGSLPDDGFYYGD